MPRHCGDARRKDVVSASARRNQGDRTPPMRCTSSGHGLTNALPRAANLV